MLGHRSLLAVWILLLLVDGACTTNRFAAAILDAETADPSEVRADLVAVRADNDALIWRDESRRQLLVASVHSEIDFEQFWSGPTGSTPEHRPLIWVTLVPELQLACSTWETTGNALSNRVGQFLGLVPDRQPDRILLLWVSPDRLFRPCPDPEVDDSICQLGEPDTAAAVPGLAEPYGDLYDELYRQSYPDGAPWTRLGYTYDWAPGSDGRGASEFVLLPGTQWTHEAASTLDDYCAPPASG